MLSRRGCATNAAVAAGAVLVAMILLELLLRLLNFTGTDWLSNGPGNRAFMKNVGRNGIGLRDRDYSQNPSQGVHRIILLGDSFAFGTGVADDNAIFPARLEEILNKQGHRVEILNIAQAGANTWKEMYLYRMHRDSFRGAKLVLLCAFANDVETPESRGILGDVVEPALSWPPPKWREYSYLLHFLDLRLRILQERQGRRRSYSDYIHDLYKDKKTKSVHVTAMTSLNDMVQADGAELLVASLPIMGPDRQDVFPEATAHFQLQAQRLNAPFIDLAPALAKHDPATLTLNKYDSHFNARGHNAVAKALAPFIVEQIDTIK